MTVLTHVLLILGVGVIAGFLNTVAGGGSLITMPALIFLGLPSAVANGTNRIALMVQNLVAITNFRRKGYFAWKFSLVLAIPAMIGAVLGARFAIHLPDSVFNKILAGVMVLVLIIMIWQPQKRFLKSVEHLSRNRQVLAAIVFFFVGAYGGFIQAGVGFVIIVALGAITGMSLVKINSLKVFVVAFYMLTSLAVFIWNREVNWLLGGTMAIGNAVGAWLGSSFAAKVNEKWMRIVLFVAVLLMAAKLVGLI